MWSFSCKNSLVAILSDCCDHVASADSYSYKKGDKMWKNGLILAKITFSWLNYPPWPPCTPCLTMLQMQMSCAGEIRYHFGRNISPETTSPGQSASSELTNVVPAPPKVLEMDWNQTEVTLYVRRRANLSKFGWYVTFWKFPSHSKILQTLTEGCGNRLSICQVRCVAVFVAPSYHISWHVQIEAVYFRHLISLWRHDQ